MTTAHQPRYAPWHALASLWRGRRLWWALSVREISRRYRGSWLGMTWLLLAPLLMLAVYVYVFGYVFQVRWADLGRQDARFAALLFCGISVFTLFSEVVVRSASLIVDNANYVKKVVFPLELLGAVQLVAAVFQFGAALAILLIYLLAIGQTLSWSILYLPVILLPLLIMTLGLSWFVSSLGAYVRDTGQAIGFLMTALLFLSPVFYPLSAIPEALRGTLESVPTVYAIEQARAVLVFGQSPQWAGYPGYVALSLLIFSGGWWWFEKTRAGFSDVL
ncbi:MAG: ABC transporter permease [Burkholderiales bacterium]|nr:ABC transporter permease [Burkholderiales bacterium]